jgi:hypothetical protein
VFARLMLTEKFMRTSRLLLVGLGGGVIWLTTPGCGGKLTDAETLAERDGSIMTGTGTTGSGTTGTGGDNTGGAGGNGATGGGSGGTSDPDPAGSGGSTVTSGTTGTGTTTGTGGSGTGGSGTGGSGATNPGGSGGSGGGSTPDASSGCPDTQPSNNSACSQPSTCNYGTMDCTCMMSGGGGNRADAGRFTWSCSGGGAGGRGGRG